MRTTSQQQEREQYQVDTREHRPCSVCGSNAIIGGMIPRCGKHLLDFQQPIVAEFEQRYGLPLPPVGPTAEDRRILNEVRQEQG